MDADLRIELGPWTPEAMEHNNPGLIAARGWNPWPTGGWRPYSYFTNPQVNLGGMVYGGHYHVWGSVWEAYVARDDSGNVGITRVTLQQGSPPSTLAIGAALDVTGTPWSSTALVRHGYQFVSYDYRVILAGDETKQMQSRDSTGGSAFADMIAAGSVDRPSGRFIAMAGPRLVLAYVRHNDATSQANYGSDNQTDELLVVFAGLKSFAYFSTEDTTTGDNAWDPEQLAQHYRIPGFTGVITGLATSAHGFGWIFCERGLWRFDYQSNPVPFELISDQHGTRSPQSVVVVDDMVYWYDQLGHLCRSSAAGPVEDLSSSSALSVLLDDDAAFLGYYPADDPTQGDNTAVGGTFAWGNTEKFRASVDLDAILGGTGLSRYPAGAYDAHSKTVRWIYPGTYTQMEGKGSVTSGQTTLSRVSGTLFTPFMTDRAIDLDAGTHTTTVASHTDEDSLELAVAAPSTITNKTWFVTFQRYLELCYQTETSVLSVTDVTHAHDKTTGERPWQMHWPISAPSFGLRLAQSSGLPQRLAYGPRDVIYAYIYTTTAGTDFYSLTYGWPFDDAGYLLLEDPQFITSFFGYPSDSGVSSGVPSEVVGLRVVYTERQRALELALDMELRVVVYTKRHAGSQRDSSGNLVGALASSEQTLDLGRTTPPTDPGGWWPLSSKAGQWHQLAIRVNATDFDVDNPENAAEIVSSIDHLEVRLRPVAT